MATKLEIAKAEKETRKKKLREAAIAYVVEAAEFGEKDSDAMAELESAALDFETAHRNLANAEAEDELEYVKGTKGDWR